MNHVPLVVLMIGLIAAPVALAQEPVALAQEAVALAQEAPPVPTDPAAAAAVGDPVYAKYIDQAIERWDAEIRKLEALDQTQTAAEDAVLFIGSSSIRLWEDIARDMAPYQPIRRGYGGAKYSDVAVFAERLIQPHRFRALVMFVANDVSGRPDDRSPDEVAALVRSILQVARRHQPEAQLFIVEITPSARRWAVWPQIRQVNAALREVCLTEPNTTFIPTAEFYLDADDQPREELFRDDQLHQNEAGYAVWSRLIKRRLDDVLQPSPSGRR